MTWKINIAVDGVAGSGKWVSSVLLAKKLGYKYLDTGAMYRVIGLYLEESGIHFDQINTQVFEGVWIHFDNNNDIYLNGENRESDIRTDRWGDLASMYARHPEVRKFLSTLQKQMVKGGWWIADGRDIWTVVMPDAQIKFFLTASVQVRAQRRLRDYVRDGITKTLSDVKREIENRDYQDMNREIDPLTELPEAIRIDTSSSGIHEQVEEMLTHIP